jgi:hypothetical protein
MAAIDQAMVSKIINATAPVGAGGIPGTWTALGAGAMKIKLTNTVSSASASGTELANGNGYVTGGQALANACTASSGGSSVTLPITTALSWTAGASSTWTGAGGIQSFELLDSAGLRTWFGTFTGAPISVAVGNTFQIAPGGITLSLS